MGKDDSDDIEWRLVATRGRESCRWQTSDNRWISLSLGAQGDLTKVMVSASDGRIEVVDGYEQGLNLARKWRASWVRSQQPTASSQSGSWLPPLPGRSAEKADISSPELPPLKPTTSPTAAGSRSRPSAGVTGQSPPGQSSPPASGSFPSRSSLNLNRVSPVSRGSNPGSVPPAERSSHSPPSRDSRRRMSGSLPVVRLAEDENKSGDSHPQPSQTSQPKR